MRNLIVTVLLILPVTALADDANIHGRWAMVVTDEDVLENLASDFHYTFQSDGVLVTETPFANYDGTWSVETAGQISLVLMASIPSASSKHCDYEISGDALEISNCEGGSPAAMFTRAE